MVPMFLFKPGVGLGTTAGRSQRCVLERRYLAPGRDLHASRWGAGSSCKERHVRRSNVSADLPFTACQSTSRRKTRGAQRPPDITVPSPLSGAYPLSETTMHTIR